MTTPGVRPRNAGRVCGAKRGHRMHAARWVRAASYGSLLFFLVASAGCGTRAADSRVTIRFWAMGREGEVVTELVRDFEREHPDIRVDVQQIPWSAAHEKLLTAYVGGSTPDVTQLGNTWIAEFAALNAIEPLNTRLASSTDVAASDYFPGIWETNVVDGEAFGVPWYVDTRVLFYRKDILARAGYREVPQTWNAWMECMKAVKRVVGDDHYAIFLPTNEFMQPVIFGLQAGSPLLAEHGTRGVFSKPAFMRAFHFYLSMFRDDLAPPIGNAEIANMYQEFARGYFAMYITGPWNLGEFERRLPDSLQHAWATAPLPGPDGPGDSIAGGSSLVMTRGSKHKDASWQLIEYLSRPEQQLRFWRLSGDLPARVEAWRDSALAADPRVAAFGDQLERAVPAPRVPEWEQIANLLQDRAEAVIRGAVPADSAFARFDREVDRLLEKRRWMIERQAAKPGAHAHSGAGANRTAQTAAAPGSDAAAAGGVAR
jgi:multiple sugar transport system substrate-binding protein